MLKSSHVEVEIETKNLSKYLGGYLDKVIRPLVLMLPKLRGYLNIFKVKDEGKDQKNNFICFCVDNDNLLNTKPFGLRLKT